MQDSVWQCERTWRDEWNPSLSVKGLSFSGPGDTRFCLLPTPDSSAQSRHLLLVCVPMEERALLLVLSEIASLFKYAITATSVLLLSGLNNSPQRSWTEGSLYVTSGLLLPSFHFADGKTKSPTEGFARGHIGDRRRLRAHPAYRGGEDPPKASLLIFCDFWVTCFVGCCPLHWLGTSEFTKVS